jgi:hypothetical protein
MSLSIRQLESTSRGLQRHSRRVPCQSRGCKIRSKRRPQRSQAGLNVNRWRRTIPAVRSGNEIRSSRPRWRDSIALQIHGRARRNNASGANAISNPRLPHVALFNNTGGSARRQSRRFPGLAKGFESIRSKALPSHHDRLVIFMAPLYV